jgi:hypothetical protein
VTEIAMPEKPAERAPRPKPVHPTMPVAKPSPAPAAAPRGPKIELPPEEPEMPELAEPELAAQESSTPDWLEPVSPMPADTPAEPTPRSVELDEAPALDAAAGEAELLDLEEVVAEDTQPPTPPRSTRVTAAPALREPAEAEAEPEAEAEVTFGGDDDDAPLGVDADDDDGDFSLGSLVRGDASDGEEEAVLAELGPAPEPEDLAPVRRTAPQAKLSPLARPTPAKATPAQAAPAKPVAARPAPAPAKPTPAKPAPAKVTPPKSSPANGEDEFDLRSLVDDEESPTGRQPALAAPAKDDDDDLDALFDEIQIGDK